MSTKRKKEQKKEAVDISENEKITFGGLQGTPNVNGDKKTIQSKKKPEQSALKETSKKISLNLEDVKKQFGTVFKITQDRYGFVALKDPSTDAVLSYLMPTKKQGISHYVKNGSTWKVKERFTNQKEIDNLFEQVSKEIEARKHWANALTPKYLHSDGFVTTSKAEMEAHLKSLL